MGGDQDRGELAGWPRKHAAGETDDERGRDRGRGGRGGRLHRVPPQPPRRR